MVAAVVVVAVLTTNRKQKIEKINNTNKSELMKGVNVFVFVLSHNDLKCQFISVPCKKQDLSCREIEIPNYS